MWKKIHFRGFFLTAIILNVLSAIFILAIRKSLPPVAPLFYGRPVGETQLVPELGLLLAPGIATLITLVNVALSLTIEDMFGKQIFAVVSFVLSLLTTITVVKIIFLII